MDKQNEWKKYYDQFEYFSVESVREGCCPRIMKHSNQSSKTIGNNWGQVLQCHMGEGNADGLCFEKRDVVVD